MLNVRSPFQLETFVESFRFPGLSPTRRQVDPEDIKDKAETKDDETPGGRSTRVRSTRARQSSPELLWMSTTRCDDNKLISSY